MLEKKQSYFYQIIIFICFFAILSALYIEHILSIPACKLCLYQRIPYILSIVVCFFGYFFLKNKIWKYLLILIFFISVVLSGYHVGIENNFFNEFSGCTNKNLDTIEKSELLQSLNKFLPSCKEVNFRILGLSLATINFLLSIALTLITIRYSYYEKNR